MPSRRTVNITGLSASDPLPGNPSEVEFTPGASGAGGGGGGGGAPEPFFALYSDVPGSITSSGGVVSAWGSLTQSTPGDRPLLVTDTVTGIKAIRFDSTTNLSVVAGGVLDALAHEGSTVIVCWRNRKFLENLEFSILDSSGGQANTGYRLLAKDQFGSGYYRELRARIINGTSVVLDESATNDAWNAFAGLKTNVIACTTTATRANVAVDHIDSTEVDAAFTLPTGSVGAFVLGNSQIDVFAVLAYSTLSDADRTTEIDRIAARFDIDVVRTVAGDGNLHIGIPGSCVLTNGDILCSYRVAVDHAANPPGYLAIKRSSDGGKTWGAAYEIHDTTSPTILDIRDSNLTQLSNGDVLINYFTADAITGYGNVQVRRSTDGGNTFGAPTTLGPFGYTLFEACSAPVYEDPAAPGTLYCPIYNMNTGGFSDSGYSKSIDNGATWGGFVVFSNGTTDSSQYYEPGFFKVSAATAARYPALTTGSVFGLVRDGTNFVMRIVRAASDWTGFTTSLATTNLLANSAGRAVQLASGRIVWIGRPFTLTSGTIYYLKSLDAGTGEAVWSIVIFDAAGLDATTGIFIYGTVLELTAGVMTIIYSPQFGDVVHNWAFVRCRAEWPEWQLDGNMPSTLLPLTTAVDPLATVQFAAEGPGNVDFTLQANNSGASINATTGLYTAGSTGGVADTVRATNINGFLIDATVNVNGSSITPPTGIDSGNLTAWWDPAQGLVLDGGSPGGGGQISTWTSVDGASRMLTGVSSPTTTTNLNSNIAVTLNGSTQYFTGTPDIQTILGTASWTVGWAFIDTGSPADAGTDFLNACILASAADGHFSLGTTATQIFAGQNSDGSGTTYDIRSATGSTVHYAVAQYDSVAGKIFLSIDGGSFDAGMTVGALGASSSITVGKSGVLGVYFKGSLGNLACWKSKLAGADLTALKAFLADSVA